MPIGAPASPVWSESTGMPPRSTETTVARLDAEDPELIVESLGGDRNVDGPPMQREPVLHVDIVGSIDTQIIWRTCPSMPNATMAPAGAATSS